jgi:hypothetical protein
MENRILLHFLFVIISVFIAIPAVSFSNDIEWTDEVLFFELDLNEVTLGIVPYRENAIKKHGEYLYMVRRITRDGITKEAILRYNLQTKKMYEFRFEDLLPQRLIFDVELNKIFVPILRRSSELPIHSNLLVYDLENERWHIIVTYHTRIAIAVKVLPNNILFTSNPPFDCCSHRLTRRNVETLEIISSDYVGGEGFSHGGKLKEKDDNLYFLRWHSNPVFGSMHRISFFNSLNALNNVGWFYKPELKDVAITDNYIIIGGSNVIEFDSGYEGEYFRYLGDVVAFNRNNWDDYFAILSDVTGTVISLETLGNTLYFMGSINEFEDGTIIGGIASYNFETSQYSTFNGGVDGTIFNAHITDDIFVISGDFVINDGNETIRHIAYWNADAEKWMPFELNNSDTSIPVPPGETPLYSHLYQNYPNPFNPITQINYDLSGSSTVRLEVYNISGQRIIRLDEGFKESGSYQVTFDGSDLASGIYLYRLITDKETLTRKMLLLK